ncbi:MAG TPA: class I SAM-dependent methyltransferase [Nitrospiria bacterium]|nr:class I SAM-dependent methyltransferase [Nitrospiria bacterium]
MTPQSKLPDPTQHVEQVKAFYANIAGLNLAQFPYFIRIYQLFDTCQREIFAQGRHGGPYESVLDVGCGEGYHTFYVARFAKQVTGLDVSPDALALAEQRARARAQRAVRVLGPDEAAAARRRVRLRDRPHPGLRRALAQLSRVCRPGALLVLDYDNQYHPGLLWDAEERRLARADPEHGHTHAWSFRGRELQFNTFGRQEMRDLLARHGFRLERAYGFDFFSFLIPKPERLHFSDHIGWPERAVMALNRLDIACRRWWPVSRWAYTQIGFARKTGPGTP